VSEMDFARKREVQGALEGLHEQLRLALAGIVVATAALRYQNADRDEEIALVLDRFVARRVAEQIERVSELLAREITAPSGSPAGRRTDA